MSTDLPYPDYLHEQTHPMHLAAIAALMGYDAVDPRGARILELGCSAGANLLPMAVSLPGAELVGVDLAAERVALGNRAIVEAGLDRVRLHALSVADIDASWGRFDYVIAHGLFSWVGPTVREAILRLVGAALNPGGLAFISYNCYPGWGSRMMAGEMMRYFARDASSGEAWVKKAKDLLEHLVALHRGGKATMVAGIEAEAERLREHDAAYILGEYNGHDHHPYFFHRFVEEARAHGLEYLGEARALSTLLPERHRPRDSSLFPGYGEEVIQTQQYIDFKIERFFRQSLLIQGDGPRSGPLTAAAIPRLWVCAEVHGGGDVQSSNPVRFNLQGQEVREARPLIKAAITTLGDAWPESLSYEGLLSASRERLKWAASADEDADARQLKTWLFEAFVADQLLLEPHPTPCVRASGPAPLASPLARYQAAGGLKVSTLRHEARSIDDAQRALLPLLNGARSVEEIAAEIGSTLPPTDGRGRAIPRGEAGVRQVLSSLGRLGVMMA